MHSPSSRFEIMPRMRADSRGPFRASRTWRGAAGLRSLRPSAAAPPVVSSMWAMRRLSRPLPRFGRNSPTSPAPLRQRAPHGADAQAAPGVERDPVEVKGAGAGEGRALLERRHVAPAQGRRRAEAAYGRALDVAGPGRLAAVDGRAADMGAVWIGASMGPQLGSCGRGRADESRPAGARASMGPQLGSCGRGPAATKRQRPDTCFNGAAT